MTPDEWLASFEATVADVQRKAAAFKENLETAGATEQSPDGSVRVTVAPDGALIGLSIADSAMRRSGAELATQIMDLARQAQRAAAANVAASFAPLTGAPPPPPPAALPQPRPATARGRATDDDDDFSNDQIFGRDEEA
jgi:DNA-binding protein YbaB